MAMAQTDQRARSAGVRGRVEREGSCLGRCSQKSQGPPVWGRRPAASRTDPPDLCGVQLSREQVHADEGAGQAAFAQRCLGRAQHLHVWGRGQSCGRAWLRAQKGTREAEGVAVGVGDWGGNGKRTRGRVRGLWWAVMAGRGPKHGRGESGFPPPPFPPGPRSARTALL